MPPTNHHDPQTPRIGLVLAGAVARGAYEAGALSVVLPELESRGERPKILVGTSSGALNAAFLASRAHEPAKHATAELVALWSTIERSKVYRLGFATPLRWLPRLERGLLDTGPLEKTIRDALGDPGRITLNLRNGDLDALAVVATDTGSGRTTVFLEMSDRIPMPKPDDKKGIDYVVAHDGIGPDHLMASAAVPVAFPPVQIDGSWFVDGGVRLNTPIKPAISLDADRIAVVATDPATHLAEAAEDRGRRPDWDDGFLLFMQAALADPLIEDLHRLARTNTLVEAATARFGSEIATTAVSVGTGDRSRSIRAIPYLFVGPAERGALGAAADAVAPGLGLSESKAISWVAGRQGRQKRELLSYVLFDPEFAREAIRIGKEDAEAELKRLADAGARWRIDPIEPPARGAG